MYLSSCFFFYFPASFAEKAVRRCYFKGKLLFFFVFQCSLSCVHHVQLRHLLKIQSCTDKHEIWSYNRQNYLYVYLYFYSFFFFIYGRCTLHYSIQLWWLQLKKQVSLWSTQSGFLQEEAKLEDVLQPLVGIQYKRPGWTSNNLLASTVERQRTSSRKLMMRTQYLCSACFSDFYSGIDHLI